MRSDPVEWKRRWVGEAAEHVCCHLGYVVVVAVLVVAGIVVVIAVVTVVTVLVVIVVNVAVDVIVMQLPCRD